MTALATAARTSTARISLAGNGPILGGVHLATLVFQRAKQLKNGSRPRVAAGSHRPTRLALLEVLADTVSWSVV